MGILRTNTLSGIGTDGPVFDGVTRLDTFGYVVPPVGVTSDRTLVGVTTAQGSIRFNTDSQKLEFFAQDQWFEMVIDTPNLGRVLILVLVLVGFLVVVSLQVLLIRLII
jgi:hypothetical protein